MKGPALPASLVLFLACGFLPAADFAAGVARTRITPPTPFWMSGYAARTHPSDGVLEELRAKALAVGDPQGHRVVFLTMDLIGLPRDVAEEVTTRATEQFHLQRSELLLNCSHTHCGPTVGRNLGVLFEFGTEDVKRVEEYRRTLADRLVRIIGEALRGMEPAELETGQGSVGFAVNRRAPTANGFRIGVNPNGPVDHAVPVLRVTGPDGRLLAVLFGYACHNTTLGGDTYQINGDYAGHAQTEIEKANPGTTALFMMLCGGDQNPSPRGTVELAQRHGQALGAEVQRVLGTALKPLHPPLRTAAETVQLDLAPHSRQTFEEELGGTDKFRQRRARLMLAAYDAAAPVRQVACRVQAIRFGEGLTFLGLGGEVVVDYALRAKREFATENLVVAGYCHDVMCYIPSRRVLHEGGYEPMDSMVYYGMPGPFAESVEEQVFESARRILKQVGAKPTGQPSNESAR